MRKAFIIGLIIIVVLFWTAHTIIEYQNCDPVCEEFERQTDSFMKEHKLSYFHSIFWNDERLKGLAFYRENKEVYVWVMYQIGDSYLTNSYSLDEDNPDLENEDIGIIAERIDPNHVSVRLALEEKVLIKVQIKLTVERKGDGQTANIVITKE